MNDGEDWSLNKTAFNDIEALVKSLHDNNQKIVPRMEMGISSVNKAGKYYQQAKMTNSLLLSVIKGSINRELTNKMHAN